MVNNSNYNVLFNYKNGQYVDIFNFKCGANHNLCAIVYFTEYTTGNSNCLPQKTSSDALIYMVDMVQLPI